LTLTVPTPLRISFARLCRDTRVMLDVTQAELAAAVGVSRSHVAGIETGRVDPSLDLVWSIADRLGIELQLIGQPPLVVDKRRSDIVHARCLAYAERRFERDGWMVARELEVMSGRTHGWIDLLAFHPLSRTMIIVEVKTRLDDVGAVERQIAWYEREAAAVALRLRWHPRRTLSWLLLLASDEVETPLSVQKQLLRRSFPDRAAAMRVICADGTAVAERRGLALIDPTSRRRGWLMASRSDGRRSTTPFKGYADAARRLSTDAASASARRLSTDAASASARRERARRERDGAAAGASLVRTRNG
jgi:DNA-binding XRE family transcriptional regulator